MIAYSPREMREMEAGIKKIKRIGTVISILYGTMLGLTGVFFITPVLGLGWALVFLIVMSIISGISNINSYKEGLEEATEVIFKIINEDES